MQCRSSGKTQARIAGNGRWFCRWSDQASVDAPLAESGADMEFDRFVAGCRAITVIVSHDARIIPYAHSVSHLEEGQLS
jgi:hypothetical protein